MKEKIDWIKEEIPFVQISNDFFNDPSISFKAKGIFSYLMSKTETWQFSSERIAHDSIDGKKSILSGLKELENAEYLYRGKLPSGRMLYFIAYTKKVGISRMIENYNKNIPENERLSTKAPFGVVEKVAYSHQSAQTHYSQTEQRVLGSISNNNISNNNISNNNNIAKSESTPQLPQNIIKEKIEEKECAEISEQVEISKCSINSLEAKHSDPKVNNTKDTPAKKQPKTKEDYETLTEAEQIKTILQAFINLQKANWKRTFPNGEFNISKANRIFANKTERSAASSLLKTLGGIWPMLQMINLYYTNLGAEYLPQATTPFMFMEKLIKIQDFFRRQQTDSRKSTVSFSQDTDYNDYN